MFNVPKYFIVGFVCLSILTAFAVHMIQSARPNSHHEMSSTAPEELAQQVAPLVAAAGATEEIQSISHSENLGCSCLQTAGDTSKVEFEDETTCSKDRLYMKPVISKVPALFRRTRARSSSEFPIECFTYIMKKWGEGSENKASTLFGRCSGAGFDGLNPKPCVTKSYVNVVYNYFSDMTDCFGGNQLDWIPRLYRESGLHLSAQSAAAVGIGQLTPVALEEANKEFAQYQAFVKISQKPSCERLNAAIQKLAPVKNMKKNNCAKLNALQDPLLNLFYANIVQNQNRDQIETITSRETKRIDLFDKMSKLGLVLNVEEQYRLTNILTLLAYNAGAGSSVIMLSNYLDYFKREGKRHLKITDLSIQGSEDHRLSFFDYIRNNQISGNEGWLDAVNEKAKDLNTQFKEGTCAPMSFLSL